MATPLRAFLLIHSAESGWNISVFQTLEEVVRHWDSRPDSVDLGVLHVGFERRAAHLFDEFISSHPGTMLLTLGAKGSLPRSFRTTNRAVGSVDGQPVFLGLDGWGYSLDEPEPVSELRPEADLEDPSKVGNENWVAFRDWVSDYVSNHPDQIDTLRNLAVFSEIDFLKLEASLPKDLRHKLTMFRHQRLCRFKDDPTDIARVAPPWLKAKVLFDLELTVRIENVLRETHLTTVSDLEGLEVGDLLRLENFGRTSVKDLARILTEALSKGLLGDQIEDVQQSGTLIESLARSLAKSDPKIGDILARRMGYNTPPETLQEIGDTYGVSRERIRQLESKGIKGLIRQEVWDDILTLKLKRILTEREFPLPLIGIEAVDPWFKGVGRNSHLMRYLLENMTESDVGLVKINGVEYIGFINHDAWERVLSSAQRLLKSSTKLGWAEEDCQRNIKALLPKEASEFGSLLWKEAARWCQFAEGEEGTSMLVAYGKGANQIVEVILTESEEPVHYSDIPSLVEAKGGPPLDERRAHAAAGQVGYLLAPGKYGTTKHLCLAIEERMVLADEAAEIVAGGPSGKQWHASELLDDLRARGLSFPDAFDKYQLDVALKERDDLYSHGRMIWSDPASGSQPRVEVRQAMIAIVKSAGEPISTDELKQRLIALRGVNSGMELHPVPPLIKLDSKTWGLNDRDLAIKLPDQPAFLDQVERVLIGRGQPISMDEFEVLFGNDIPPRALMSIAALDNRFEATRDRRLRLKRI